MPVLFHRHALIGSRPRGTAQGPARSVTQGRAVFVRLLSSKYPPLFRKKKMPRFHHAVKTGAFECSAMRQLPYDGANQQVQKRLGSRPLSRSSRHPCLQTQYRPDRIRLSRRNFHGIIKETNVRWEGMLWNARSCTVTVTRFMSRWRRCSTPRWPKGRARSAAIRKAGAASSLQNEKAKAFGVQTAETIWQARRKCPDLRLVAPHRSEYVKYSRRCNELYLQYTDLVDPFGIDESFLDVTGTAHLFGTGSRSRTSCAAACAR